ncbi:microsomal signal peptidase 25 kDa subunit-domain-containing protein [Coprinopsis sp. MPI-PUGE-AT-0042]|nr:microsomal signal peptidase 25 kDa subunit-domain-containing protein [Coprinopsis sp. MPI-PUGE-AT-0042]
MGRSKSTAVAAGPTNGSTSSSTHDLRRSLSPDSPSDRPLGPLSVTVPASEREEVKVNNASVVELKNACDDAIKKFLSRPELFKQIHLHTDIRLGLGWLCVFVAGGTAFYGYKIDFETSKPVVTIGLIVYIILTTLSTLYAYFVEGDTIFVGKRKTFSKRIITERINIASSTLPASPSSKSSSSNSTSNPKSDSSVAPFSPVNAPSYSLSLAYIRSTNGGKSLLKRGKSKANAPYTRFFDEKGVMDQEALEQWVAGLVEGVMDGKAA